MMCFALDTSNRNGYKEGVNDFSDILIAENLPLNGKMVCYIQNSGIGRILFDGKQVTISKKSRRAFYNHFLAGQPAATPTFSPENAFIYVPIRERVIHFHNGVPQHFFRSTDLPWFNKPNIERNALKAVRGSK